jgi:predicted AAA+ superfamily ATPase
VDAQLTKLLNEQPAVVLQGAKGVGKTATASRLAGSVVTLERGAVLDSVRADPEGLARREKPVFVDEWQLLPSVWNTVRRFVDDGAEPGSFLLAGSMVPREAAVHSGAGRMVELRMRPMSLAERGLDAPTVSLASLLAGSAVVGGETAVGLPEYVAEIVGSGFPGVRALPAAARPDRLTGYAEAIVTREFAQYGQVVRRPDTLRRWLAAYAAATGTVANYSTILDAATPGEGDKPGKTTTISYRDALSALWMLDEVPAWASGAEVYARLAATPKHFLADPALAVALLELEESDLLEPETAPEWFPEFGPLTGRLFEALIGLSLQTYAQASKAHLSYLRTRDGRHEIDFIVERKRRIVAIEVKMAQTATDADVRHLVWLKQQLGDRLADAIFVTTGPYAYRRSDGIAVVPASLLGP